MKIARSLAELGSFNSPSVVTVGNFDGVHCGHRRVIASVLERARALNAQAVAVTFDPHPAHVLRTDSRLPLITPIAEKLELLAATGLDLALVLPFTEELRRWKSASGPRPAGPLLLHPQPPGSGQRLRHALHRSYHQPCSLRRVAPRPRRLHHDLEPCRRTNLPWRHQHRQSPHLRSGLLRRGDAPARL